MTTVTAWLKARAATKAKAAEVMAEAKAEAQAKLKAYREAQRTGQAAPVTAEQSPVGDSAEEQGQEETPVTPDSPGDGQQAPADPAE